MKRVGFIGVGIMGKSMVRNLMKVGFEVAIYTRTKAKVEDVLGMYEKLQEEGLGDLGTQALIKYYEK